jgi:hypothetical protein
MGATPWSVNRLLQRPMCARLLCMASSDAPYADTLCLPVAEHARLAHELLPSLEDGEVHPDAEGAWVQELERRAQDILMGAIETEDADEVLDRISTRLLARQGG